jgi:hypothetical protein
MRVCLDDIVYGIPVPLNGFIQPLWGYAGAINFGVGHPIDDYSTRCFGRWCFRVASIQIDDQIELGANATSALENLDDSLVGTGVALDGLVNSITRNAAVCDGLNGRYATYENSLGGYVCWRFGFASHQLHKGFVLLSRHKVYWFWLLHMSLKSPVLRQDQFA